MRAKKPPQIRQRIASMGADRNVVRPAHPLICRLANEQQTSGPQHSMYFRYGLACPFVVKLVDHIKARHKIKLVSRKRKLIRCSQRYCVESASMPELGGMR